MNTYSNIRWSNEIKDYDKCIWNQIAMCTKHWLKTWMSDGFTIKQPKYKQNEIIAKFVMDDVMVSLRFYNDTRYDKFIIKDESKLNRLLENCYEKEFEINTDSGTNPALDYFMETVDFYIHFHR